MTQVLESPTVDAPRRRRGWMPWVGALVIAVLLGGVGGWFVRGALDGDDVADVVVVGGSELTARQQQMIDLHRQLVAEMQANDGAGVVSLFDPAGQVVFTKSGQEYRVDDGSLQEMVDAGINCYVDPSRGFAMYEPLLVDADMVVSAGMNEGVPFVALTEVTPYGDVRIERHEITW